MSTLYRTPDFVIDEFEFHISIEVKDGRVRKFTRWRPASPVRRLAWRPIAEFPGNLPKPHVFKAKFKGCQRHIEMAHRSIEAQRVQRAVA